MASFHQQQRKGPQHTREKRSTLILAAIFARAVVK